MKRTFAILATTVSLGLAALASAAGALAEENTGAGDEPGKRPPHHERMENGDGVDKKEKRAERRREHFEDMDANKDGAISKEEFMANAEKHFVKKDKNGDGKITADERKRGRPGKKNAVEGQPATSGEKTSPSAGDKAN